jgi:hypothetical protein
VDNFDWHFRPKHAGDDISDPIAGEFFADGSLENPATALVREALQNALDAGKNVPRHGQPVRVRIGLHRGSHALPAARAARWFGTLRGHLDAKGNGLKDVPNASEDCEFLVVEDFGTSGLTGDIASDSADGPRNNFVDFLRSDGRTRKGEGDRGSWGVGKNVFPRASRINGYLAFTVTYDKKLRLLMGKSILKIRRVGTAQYQPACYLGASWGAGEVPKPHTADGPIDAVREDFRLKRDNDPGLSLVMPWVDTEITYDDLLRAVATEFYFAILGGGLAVTLTNGDAELTLDRGDIIERVQALMPAYAPMVGLAAWALGVSEGERSILIAPAAGAPQKWVPDSVPEAVRTVVTAKLLGGERVALRVPLHIRDVNASGPQPTYFDVFLEHDESPRQSRPSFFREQLAISGVKRALGAPKVRALVVVNDAPLAGLLRAAEPPNHTDWDPKTANFRKAYKDGNHVITFVKSAVSQLMGIVRGGDEKPDANVAIDFFALPEPDRPAPPSAKAAKKPKPGTVDPPPPPPPPPRQRRFTVTSVQGGFVIRPGPAGTTPPKKLVVVMAYDVLSGSPWKQYEAADFDLERKDKSGIQIAASGDADHKVAAPNRIEVALGGPTFEVYVTGFDPNRDLIVRAYDPKEPVDADPATELHEEAEAHA